MSDTDSKLFKDLPMEVLIGDSIEVIDTTRKCTKIIYKKERK